MFLPVGLYALILIASSVIWESEILDHKALETMLRVPTSNTHEPVLTRAISQIATAWTKEIKLAIDKQ